MSDRKNPWNEDVPFSIEGMWIATGTCQRRINRRISGREEVEWLPYVLDRYFVSRRSERRCLVLGCSEGWVVERLCRAGFTGEIVASDIAEKALGRARERLHEFRNIVYVSADLNSHRFEGPFDLIIAEGVLHHIENVKECLKGLHDALAPAGMLVAVEWEGPFRFQLPDEQLRWINAALNVLPKKFRGGFAEDPERELPATTADMARVHYPRVSAESIEAFDPSEAVAGYLLREAIAGTFRVIERKPLWGQFAELHDRTFPVRSGRQGAGGQRVAGGAHPH